MRVVCVGEGVCITDDAISEPTSLYQSLNTTTRLILRGLSRQLNEQLALSICTAYQIAVAPRLRDKSVALFLHTSHGITATYERAVHNNKQAWRLSSSPKARSLCKHAKTRDNGNEKGKGKRFLLQYPA